MTLAGEQESPQGPSQLTSPLVMDPRDASRPCQEQDASQPRQERDASQPVRSVVRRRAVLFD